MRKLLFSLALMMSVSVMADDKVVSSPDGRLVVTISCNEGKASYGVKYDGMEVLKASSLGLKTNVGDFTKGLKMLTDEQRETLRYAYLLSRSKYSSVSVEANQLKVNFETEAKIPMSIVFCVKDNDVAFKYQLGRGPKDNPKCAVVYEETTAFNFPDETRTFLCPQITPMTGWERTKPSYEEEYEADAPMNQKSKFGVGFTFPCLFRVPQVSSVTGKMVPPQTKLWILVSETGVSSAYCGARLSDYESGRGYTVAYPQKGENNGFGSEFAGIMLPGETPWRTITVGNNLKPIVETTVPFDFVKPLYEPSINYQPGRYTWSWLVWQDNSINYDDQVKFIDLAAAQGYEYTLVDNWWDTQIG
ncbi:MAG: glycoside hydrolase family 97 N-terminal domain-containing protein, partial [Prevotella sp.]|nr:glycoside hydrolase family 97 N-terminal domain-containing protein [Prevotella sp.]